MGEKVRLSACWEGLRAAYDQLLCYREALENRLLFVVCDKERFEIHTNLSAGAALESQQERADRQARPEALLAHERQHAAEPAEAAGGVEGGEGGGGHL